MAAMPSRAARAKLSKAVKWCGSCRDIRDKLDLQHYHLILDLELAFFEAAQLQLIVVDLGGKTIDDLVEVPMLDLQFYNAAPDLFGIHQFRLLGEAIISRLGVL